MISDPVYLSEPLVKTNGFSLNPNGSIGPYPCRPAVEVPHEAGYVPHHGLEDTAHTREFAQKYGLPYEATRGGAETALPEYMSKLPSMPKATTAPAPRPR
jgi:hypothetical protein